MKSRSPDEKKLKSLEKKRTAALEMAQEKDETKKKSAANEKEGGPFQTPHSGWGHGVVRDPRGLQLLLGVIANGFTDFTECPHCVKYDD